LFNLAQF